MSNLRKKLDRASFRHEDVDVCLNGELANQRDALLKEREAAASKPTPNRLGVKSPAAEVQARLEALDEEMRKDLITLRFRTLSFDKWNRIVAQYPPQDNVPLDRRKGYDVVAVTKETAQASGWLVEDGTPETIEDSEWKDLWENLSGGDFDRVWGAVTRLNEEYGWVGVEFLKKESAVTPDSTGTSS